VTLRPLELVVREERRWPADILIASWNRAKTERPRADPKTFKSIIAAYMESPAFTKRRERTRADYLKHIRKIEDAFGDLPIAALNDPRVTKDFLDWRDSMADSPRQADYSWTVLVRILSWARSPHPHHLSPARAHRTPLPQRPQ
jgi:hypothetical protein